MGLVTAVPSSRLSFMEHHLTETSGAGAEVVNRKNPNPNVALPTRHHEPPLPARGYKIQNILKYKTKGWDVSQRTFISFVHFTKRKTEVAQRGLISGLRHVATCR